LILAQHPGQLFQLYGFADVIIHAGIKALLSISFQSVGSYGLTILKVVLAEYVHNMPLEMNTIIYMRTHD
jgi:hypothetical protein